MYKIKKYFYSMTDVDECSTIPDICGDNSTCTNTDGSYECECDDGYEMFGNRCLGKILNFLAALGSGRECLLTL